MNSTKFNKRGGRSGSDNQPRGKRVSRAEPRITSGSRQQSPMESSGGGAEARSGRSSAPHSHAHDAAPCGLPGVEGKSTVKFPSVMRCGLDDLVQKHGLLRSAPVHELRPMPHTDEVRLCIDGEMLLRDFRERVQMEETLAALTSAVPKLITTQLIPRLITMLESLSLTLGSGASPLRLRPILVFGGMSYMPGSEPRTREVPAEPLFITDCHMKPGSQIPRDVLHKVADRFFIAEDVEAAVVRELKRHLPEVLRAPYFTWPQISSFFLPTNTYVSEVYGSLELLAFPDVERVITRIDPTTHTFQYVARSELMDAAMQVMKPYSYVIHFGAEEFNEWVLMDSVKAPYTLDFIPSTLEEVGRLVEEKADRIISDGPALHTPPPAVRAGSSANSGSASCPPSPKMGLTRVLLESASEEQRRRLNANIAVLDAPVLTLSSCVMPLSVLCNSPPHSELPMISVVGSPLPTVVYFAISAGLFSPYVFTAAGQNVIVNRIPLVDSPLFRSVTKRLVALRFIASMVIRSSYDCYASPDYFYDESIRIRSSDRNASKYSPLLGYNLQNWSEAWPVCGDGFINQPKYRSDHATTVFSEALSFFDVVRFASEKLLDPEAIPTAAAAAHAALAKAQSAPLGSPSMSSPYLPFSPAVYLPPARQPPTTATVPECCAMAMLKTLDSLGYFSHNHDMLDLSLWGKFMLQVGDEHQFFDEIQIPPLKPTGWTHMSEYLILLVDLIRSGALHDEPIQMLLGRSPDSQVAKGVRFACRLLSIMPLTLKDGALWRSPFAPEIAAFNNVARTLMHTLRETLEGMTVGLFVTRSTLVPLEQMAEVVSQLPFQTPPDCYTGNIVLYLLTAKKPVHLKELREVFPEWAGEKGDVFWWLEFWRRAMHLLEAQTLKEIQTCMKDDNSVDSIRCANELVVAALMRLLSDS